ncbi:MAG TPA: hypothetical protein VLR90_05445 [Blastocatellia bacterium]|nr:hypothetical protein [Blastocatellia bacterium]
MKSICIVVILSLSLSATAFAQKRKQRANPRARVTKREPATNDNTANKPRLVGSQITIITKNDDRITGTLLDLTAYSVRIKADNLESVIALDTIASISFGSATPPIVQPVSVPAREDFLREADITVNSFQSLATQLKSNTDYTEYGRLLGELRRTGEQFVARNGATDNPTEARVVGLMASALTDYTWARTIWTLKFGRSGDVSSVYDTDSPTITDAFSLYPDLRASAASGGKFSVDKIVSGLWRKAAEKTDRARSLISPSK